MGLTLVQMLLIDVCFVGVLALLLSQLARKRQASFAVLRRNFLAYFANPTGYVFLCVFVFTDSTLEPPFYMHKYTIKFYRVKAFH